MKNLFGMIGFLLCATATLSFAQETNHKKTKEAYTKANVSYSDFEMLMKKVKPIRAKRMISFNQLLAFQQEKNTVLLDTRSVEKYNARHIKGAINLPYTEFTQYSLEDLIPNKDTKILIYCNNNIDGDQIFFESKSFEPKKANNKDSPKPIMLALNVPTYITLFGYGYQNIYELDEMVHIKDPRVNFKGTNISKIRRLLSK